MSDSTFLAGGLVAFGAACLAHYAGWQRLLQVPLATPDPVSRRASLIRWAFFAAGWQALVLVAAASWLAVNRGHHGRGLMWTAPAIGLVVGTALALQVVAVLITRRLRS
jgi:hypothetical protein